MSAFDVEYAFKSGYKAAVIERKGKGWEEIQLDSIRVNYGFKCKDCGAKIGGFIVSPRFCPYCGKEHG